MHPTGKRVRGLRCRFRRRRRRWRRTSSLQHYSATSSFDIHQVPCKERQGVPFAPGRGHSWGSRRASSSVVN